MERIFGPKIASMVDGLTKMSGVFNADTSEQAEYLSLQPEVFPTPDIQTLLLLYEVLSYLTDSGHNSHLRSQSDSSADQTQLPG